MTPRKTFHEGTLLMLRLASPAFPACPMKPYEHISILLTHGKVAGHEPAELQPELCKRITFSFNNRTSVESLLIAEGGMHSKNSCVVKFERQPAPGVRQLWSLKRGGRDPGGPRLPFAVMPGNEVTDAPKAGGEWANAALTARCYTRPLRTKPRRFHRSAGLVLVFHVVVRFPAGFGKKGRGPSAPARAVDLEGRTVTSVASTQSAYALSSRYHSGFEMFWERASGSSAVHPWTAKLMKVDGYRLKALLQNCGLQLPCPGPLEYVSGSHHSIEVTRLARTAQSLAFIVGKGWRNRVRSVVACEAKGCRGIALEPASWALFGKSRTGAGGMTDAGLRRPISLLVKTLKHVQILLGINIYRHIRIECLVESKEHGPEVAS
ncbi:unnamed protein product [Pleuronectes platessa]|uniref:Uncharacterized protein n=1 Tax=Pleuronectes platessa TaxID=8262 RepID=A0A9N7ZCA2_PLEPL|nr:unnamed protein product [Pleuronectes platessa]